MFNVKVIFPIIQLEYFYLARVTGQSGLQGSWLRNFGPEHALLNCTSQCNQQLIKLP